MAVSGRAIRSRIKSVKNTKKITKAMELVSAAKMRRAVSAATNARAYARYAWELLTHLNEQSDIAHPLLAVRPVRRILLVVISSNRGLAGAFSSNIMKRVVQQVRNPQQLSRNRSHGRWIEPPAGVVPQIDFIVVGKRAETAVRKLSSNIIASFVDFSDVPKFDQIQPLVAMARDGYTNGTYDKVAIVYTEFISALTQTAKVRQLLPVSPVDIEKLLFSEDADDALPEDTAAWQQYVHFEPSLNEILVTAVSRLMEQQVYQALLESAASEQSARMMAMRTATDAATDMIDSLTLMFNQARQASITKEISEISAGKAALE